MSHIVRAKHHHGLIGKALAAGDHRTAMQHTGHLLNALRSASTMQPAEEAGETAPDAEITEPAPSSLRSRLKSSVPGPTK